MPHSFVMGRPPRRATNGETTVPDGRPMKYAHGQYPAYVLDRCRCDECRSASRDYERARQLAPVPAYVDAAPAREHIAWLATQGVGLKQVAKQAGVAHGALSKLVYGLPNRPPSKRCRRDTLERILAVSIDARAGGARVDAETTWALINEMLDAGATRAQLALLLGSSTPALQLGTDTVKVSTAHQVADIYREWKTGDLTLGRHDRYGNFHQAIPTTTDIPARLVPAAVPVDMRRHRNKKVVAAARVEIPTPQADIVVCATCTGAHATQLCPKTAPPPTARPGWPARAQCADKPTWLFFPTNEDEATTRKAKQVCISCPVRLDCLITHLQEPAGIFGGLTERERSALTLDTLPFEVAQ